MDCVTADHLVQVYRSVLAARDREIAALQAQLAAVSENLHQVREKAAALDEIAETLDLSTDDPIQVVLFVAGQKHGLIELADEKATLRAQLEVVLEYAVFPPERADEDLVDAVTAHDSEDARHEAVAAPLDTWGERNPPMEICR